MGVICALCDCIIIIECDIMFRLENIIYMPIILFLKIIFLSHQSFP